MGFQKTIIELGFQQTNIELGFQKTNIELGFQQTNICLKTFYLIFVLSNRQILKYLKKIGKKN